MFDLELGRPWTLDFRKMKRPERSGVAANLLCYTLLWLWGYQFIPHDFGDEFSLKCYLMPWECPKAEPEQAACKPRRATPLYFPTGKIVERKRACHLDILEIASGKIEHVHEIDDSVMGNTLPRSPTWIDPPKFCAGSSRPMNSTTYCMDVAFYIRFTGMTLERYLSYGQQKYRWHCENGKYDDSLIKLSQDNSIMGIQH